MIDHEKKIIHKKRSLQKNITNPLTFIQTFPTV